MQPFLTWRDPQHPKEIANKRWVESVLANIDLSAYFLTSNHTKQTHDSLNINADTVDGDHASAFERVGRKGIADGYAPLDSQTLVPRQYLPGISISSRSKVASEAEQLALVGQEEGDVAIRTDIRRSYIHNAGTTGTMADWDELLSPTDQVWSVNGQIGDVRLGAVEVGARPDTWVPTFNEVANKPTTYPPEAHGHGNVTSIDPGFMAAADKAKLDSYPSIPSPTDVTQVLRGDGTFGSAPSGGALSVIVTVDTTLNASHGTVFVDAGTGAKTITLPSAVDFDNRYIVKKIDASANTVTIVAPTGQTIEGLASISTDHPGDAVEIESDGSNWRIISAPTTVPPPVTNARITQAILETDGPGSLYDADMLDGKQGAEYALVKQEAWRVIGDAGQPAFEAGWSNYTAGSFAPVAFFKDSMGIVHLRGLLNSANATGTTVFTLPVGYRPLNTLLHMVMATSAVGRVDISPAGAVIHQLGTATFLQLDGITFRAEA